ncbi:MAG TPA: hypothetical protein QF761_06480 [Pirellulales bacterium]|mgnify:CR=1 FL=1|nr:hypothetical protein [Pirellulales bacterium]
MAQRLLKQTIFPLQVLYSLFVVLITNPHETLRILQIVPQILRGSLRAAHWHESLAASKDNQPTVSSGHQKTNNRLKEFFDARTSGRGIWKWLHYFDIYDQHFKKFVGKEVRILEIGIYSGGSLEMWKSYFGPKCHVYGVDISEHCKRYEDESTTVFIGDQGSESFWQEFKAKVPQVDIIIDDGSHLPEHQIITLEQMLPHISGGGIYLCEDVHGTHNQFSAYISGFCTRLNGMSWQPDLDFQKWIHSIHQYPFVTVIEKHLNRIDTLEAKKHGTLWDPLALYDTGTQDNEKDTDIEEDCCTEQNNDPSPSQLASGAV